MTTFQDIRTTLLGLLPTLLMIMAGGASAMFCALVVVPQLQHYEAVHHQLTAAEATLAANVNDHDDTLTILAAQIEKAQTELSEAANTFFTEDQIDLLLDKLYHDAADSNVMITTLQSQQPPVATTPTLYDVKIFRLQVNGAMPDLLQFLTQLEETAAVTFIVQNLSIGRGETGDMLRFDIYVYTSRHADGGILTELTPLAVPTQIATSVVPTAIPVTAVLASTTTAPSSAATNSTMSENPGGACAEVLPTLFKVGDIAVVDFDEGGALNILAKPRTAPGAIETLALAYNNNYLEIMEGPVCGTWNNTPLFYWRINRDGIQGWVGESLGDDRWLCPLNNPDCSS